MLAEVERCAYHNPCSVLNPRAGLLATQAPFVGFCDAGPARRHVSFAGEVYAIYLVHHAKRYGLGAEMFTRVRTWFADNAMSSMIVKKTATRARA